MCPQKKSEHKKKVLLFIDWYLPGVKAGGPIRSVYNMVKLLSADVDFRIVTTNTDLGDNAPYKDIEVNRWVNGPGNVPVYYFDTRSPSASELTEMLNSVHPDVVYFNSMYSRHFMLKPLRLTRQLLPDTPVVLAPRGMLSPGALLIKPFRKRLFLIFARSVGWFDNIHWHASSAIEESEIRNVFGKKARITVARNLTIPTNVTSRTRSKSSGRVKLVYVARISPVKNLLQCLQVLNSLPEDCMVSFDIYGHADDHAYMKRCNDLIASLPPNVEVTLKGTVPNAELPDLLNEYHFFFLLTPNENFGHAIVESLSAGCPVIISDSTPWNGLSEAAAGWDLPLDDMEEIRNAVCQACMMDQEEYDTYINGALEMAGKIHHDDTALSMNKKLFGVS